MSSHASAPPVFHVMTKPAGPLCNLDCSYCFYVEKQDLFPKRQSHRMSDEVLERYIRGYIESQRSQEVQFAWQGGEPTLLGVKFFEQVIALQNRYAHGRTISNALQTNGTLLDDEWGEFLHRHQFLVGVSIDGPRHLHDAYRVDKQGRPTFDQVIRGIEILRKHRVDFNTLTVVNRENARRPLEVYRFLKGIGSGFIQFIPVVERENPLADFLATPPDPGQETLSAARVTRWSVRPVDYGQFLAAIFREWVRRDVGTVFVQTFDVTLGAWAGAPPGLCVFAPKCGDAVALEANGDVYSCDHYVYPEYRLGNITESTFPELLGSARQRKFGSDKTDALPDCCRTCRYLFACNGGCPKHRFLQAPNGQPGLNYLCAGYKAFFKASEPQMKQMAALLHAGQPAARIMEG
jgi:uncharacterized protein